MAAINPETVSHYFSDYGGMFVAEILVPALQQIEHEYKLALQDEEFMSTLEQLLANYAGRPTPVFRGRSDRGRSLCLRLIPAK